MEVTGSERKVDREREDQAIQELVEHLKSIAPFNKRWQVSPWRTRQWGVSKPATSF